MKYKALVVGMVSAMLMVSLHAIASDVQASQPQQVTAPTAGQESFSEAAAAPIRSRHDLELHLKGHAGDSPLMALSPLNKQLFLDSLRFNDKGVTTLRYDVLESLTPSQAYQVLGLFGMQGLTPQLHLRTVSPLDTKVMSITPSLMPLKDYYCEGRGTCRKGANTACSDAC